MANRYRIVFAGTPAFAVPSLAALIASNHDVVAVYTQQDRPSGRGQKQHISAVKELALQHNIAIEQPLNFKQQDAVEQLKSYQPDILVVVAYGLILPQSILDIPRLACLNVHASLLPRWRGAAPINHAILAGDTTTGVSIMELALALDAGPVYVQKSCEITATTNALDLHDDLSELGSQALITTIDEYIARSIKPVDQDDSLACYAHKMTKQDGEINLNKNAIDIIRHINAMQPWPGAYFYYDDKIIKVFDAFMVTDFKSQNTAEIISWNRGGLTISCVDRAITITKLQLPGKKAMSASEIWSGHRDLFKIGNSINTL